MVFNFSEEDKEAGAKLLYETVEFAYLNNKKLPNEAELMKIARSDLEIGLVGAKQCVDKMEKEYGENLISMNYFSWQRKNV